MKTLVVAPHPDDEVIGVGGTLKRRHMEGSEISWLIVTGVSGEAGWSEEIVVNRQQEIASISEMFQFAKVYQLDLPTTQLDVIPMSSIVTKISSALQDFQPEEIFIPHSSDVHTDHKIVFEAVVSSTKWFRSSFVKRILAYETLSETDFGLDSKTKFNPNVFSNITDFLDFKLKALSVYKSEIGAFPFPRSLEAVKALAQVRGATSGFPAAEGFELLRERY